MKEAIDTLIQPSMLRLMLGSLAAASCHTAAAALLWQLLALLLCCIYYELQGFQHADEGCWGAQAHTLRKSAAGGVV